MEGKVKFKVNKEDKAKEKRQIRFLIAVKYTSSCSIVSHNAKHLKLCSNNTYILFQKERKSLNFSHCHVAICNCQSQMLIRKSSITNCHTANDTSVSFPKRSLTLLLTNILRDSSSVLHYPEPSFVIYNVKMQTSVCQVDFQFCSQV